MKKCSKQLLEYLVNTNDFVTCDLYTLILRNGAEYDFVDGDTDVVAGNKVYIHDKLIINRDQTKITGTPSVDTLSLTINANKEDMGMNILGMAHDGLLDDSSIELERAYFDPESNALVDTLKLFKGRAEVESAGGITLKLVAKSKTTGLSQLFPVRIYAPGAAYVLGPNGEVISSSTDEVTCAIPLKPNSNILGRGIF